MALTATASQGFEPLRLTSGEEIFYLPGDPGVTFTKGDAVIITGGVLVLAGDSSADVVGTVMKTTVCPAASQAATLASQHNPIAWDAEDKCLIPIKLQVAANEQVYRATFAAQIDDTVITYTSGTRAIAATTGHGTDDYPNGAMLYVYEGPGMGEVNVVEDYDHTGGAAELLLICHRAFNAALTSSSKYIVVTGEAAAGAGITFMGRIDQQDHNNLHAADGYNDGDWVVFMDWLKAPYFLKNLTLPVIRRTAIYSA